MEKLEWAILDSEVMLTLVSRRASFRADERTAARRVEHVVANETSPQELFWVIKNGINMTGMPSFGAIDVPDQGIWSIVAFVKKLPTVSEEDFKTWTRQ